MHCNIFQFLMIRIALRWYLGLTGIAYPHQGSPGLFLWLWLNQSFKEILTCLFNRKFYLYISTCCIGIRTYLVCLIYNRDSCLMLNSGDFDNQFNRQRKKAGF